MGTRSPNPESFIIQRKALITLLAARDGNQISRQWRAEKAFWRDVIPAQFLGARATVVTDLILHQYDGGSFQRAMSSL
jgi:hypothetical protein